MGKFIVAGLLGFLGLGLLSDYPMVGVGMLCAAGLIGWMSLQGRQSSRSTSHVRPTEWAQARQESAVEVARAEREARAMVRRAVKQADKRGQAAVRRAAELVQAEQSSGWSA
ncbi:Uncharacterised protein [Mycobacteroides abscessus subsp. abscessus]|uniref:hypothetical protein n=1 Tax=Mycobacteroides abscessus TaxID=36809 RepID=UPI0009A6E1A2|nr:hypothetical protein [Mycobacteroides abscessus]MBN7388560.1 hypothetical protein [Mycobacteroides abscessus subsp. abscessus]MBN7414830.1 hypothetical protein [Mycobacteroides abscessus subsp. abscessus]MDO2961018.1 hypothetical protein [Mycobacteroides abscessus subsp. abscessus]MDO2994986.1 hypothetical protein [Mycobacteroides abscessus subsp. abscessus]MDO3064361.1 hypothetical protein [Mycobacteroides abscessus subsp. abscessus]